MAALDFKALMREERLKMKGQTESPRQSKVVEQKKDPPLLFDSKLIFPPRALSTYRLNTISSISYIPNFVTENESKEISQFIHSIPFEHSKWVNLKGRSLQCWDGTSDELPQWLEVLCDSLVSSGFFPSHERPNHVLINRYLCGDGIFPHTDGPKYIPRTATLSLSVKSEDIANDDVVGDICVRIDQSLRQEGALMTFQPRLSTSEIGIAPNPLPACQVALLANSLVIFEDEAYSNYLHGIATVESSVTGNEIEAHSPAELIGSQVANAAIENLLTESRVYRPYVRISLTFRHIL